MSLTLRVLAAASCAVMALHSAMCGEATGQERARAAGRTLIGTAAPRLVLETIDGEAIDLGALYGRKAVYLKFWATWCVPCREQMPHFEHTYETAGSDLAVIAVNVGFNDSLDEIRKYRRKLHITMPIVIDDGRLAAAFNLRVTPQHIVIGRDGRIEYVGHLADTELDGALRVARTKGSPRQAVLGAPAREAAIQRTAVGEGLPAVTVPTLDGPAFSLRERGAPTVLLFLSPWCESYLATTRPQVAANCRSAREQVAALAGHRGVRWLGVASGLWANADDLRQYRTRYQIDIPLTLDESGRLFREFGVTDTPTVIIANAAGTIVRRIDSDATSTLSQSLGGL